MSATYHLSALKLPGGRTVQVPEYMVDLAFTVIIWLLNLPVFEVYGNFASTALIIYNMFWRDRVWQSLVTLILLLFLNPVLFNTENFSYLRWVLIIAAFLKEAFRSRFEIPKVFLIFTPFLAFTFIHSLAVSFIPVLSLFKIFLMGIGIFTLTKVRNPRDISLEWLVGVIGVILVTSLLTLPFLSIGFAVNGRGFQGILNHPQAFGLINAVFAMTLILLSRRVSLKLRRFMMAGGLLLSGYVVLSNARTALLALALVVFFREAVSLRRRFTLPRLIVLLSVAAVCAVSSTVILDRVEALLFKRSGAASLTQAAIASRGEIVDNSLKNIGLYPWTGIGFGVPSNLSEKAIVRDPFLGLPLSAPIEKGVFITAITEELGYPGAVIYALTLLVLVGYVLSRRDLDRFFLLIMFFLINLGEMVMFSFGALGLLGWALVLGFPHLKPRQLHSTKTLSLPAALPPARTEA